MQFILVNIFSVDALTTVKIHLYTTKIRLYRTQPISVQAIRETEGNTKMRTYRGFVVLLIIICTISLYDWEQVQDKQLNNFPEFELQEGEMTTEEGETETEASEQYDNGANKDNNGIETEQEENMPPEQLRLLQLLIIANLSEMSVISV